MAKYVLYSDCTYIQNPYKWSKSVEEFIGHSEILANTFTWAKHEFKLEKVTPNIYKLQYNKIDVIPGNWARTTAEHKHTEDFTIIAINHNKTTSNKTKPTLVEDILEQCAQAQYIPASVMLFLHFNQTVAHTSISIYTSAEASAQARLNFRDIFLTERKWGHGKCCYDISRCREPADKHLCLTILKHLALEHKEKLSDEIKELETRILVNDFATRTISVEKEQDFLIKYLLHRTEEQDIKIAEISQELEKIKTTFRTIAD